MRKLDLKGERRDVEGEQEKRTGFSIIHTLMLPHLEQTHWPNGTHVSFTHACLHQPLKISSARDHKEEKGTQITDMDVY